MARTVSELKARFLPFVWAQIQVSRIAIAWQGSAFFLREFFRACCKACTESFAHLPVPC